MQLAYFEEWKGTDTLLFSCNGAAALRLLESAIARLMASDQHELEFHTLPFVPHGAIAVVSCVVAVDSGDFPEKAVGSFRWARSSKRLGKCRRAS